MNLLNNKSSNPMFNEKILDNLDFVKEEKMTVSGTVNKTILLLIITVITAFFSWQQMLTIFSMPLMFGIMILGVILVFAGIRKPQYAHIIAPTYAFVEGLFIGAISAIYASAFEGIVVNAALLTFGTLFLMLFIYKSGIIKVLIHNTSMIIPIANAIFEGSFDWENGDTSWSYISKTWEFPIGEYFTIDSFSNSYDN